MDRGGRVGRLRARCGRWQVDREGQPYYIRLPLRGCDAGMRVLGEHFADAFPVVDAFDGFCEEGGYGDYLNFV